MRDTDFDDDAIDALLRVALADRPEPAGVGSADDLAARVLATATPRGVTPQIATVPAWPTWAAALATAAVLVFGILRVMALGDASGSTDTTIDTAAVTSAATDTVALLPAGGIGLLMILAYLTARSAFATPEPVAV